MTAKIQPNMMRLGAQTLGWLVVACGVGWLSGCQPPPRAEDRIVLHPDDDVFVAQSPYAMDHQVVVLARTEPLVYAGGSFVMTGGREIVVVSPQSWRAYTGQALTAEEAQLRILRAERAAQAAAQLRDTLLRIANRLEDSAEKTARFADERMRAISDQYRRLPSSSRVDRSGKSAYFKQRGSQKEKPHRHLEDQSPQADHQHDAPAQQEKPHRHLEDQSPQADHQHDAPAQQELPDASPSNRSHDSIGHDGR